MNIDHYTIPPALDKRRKLTDEDKENIRDLYTNKHLKIREISRMYPQVSKRLIQFTLFPERLKAVNFAGHYKKYYDTKRNTEYMATHRGYKKTLLARRLLVAKKEDQ
jgi:hypothetical protein